MTANASYLQLIRRAESELMSPRSKVRTMRFEPVDQITEYIHHESFFWNQKWVL